MKHWDLISFSQTYVFELQTQKTYGNNQHKTGFHDQCGNNHQTETVWACSQHIIGDSLGLQSAHYRISFQLPRLLVIQTLLIPLMNHFCRLMLVVAVSQIRFLLLESLRSTPDTPMGPRGSLESCRQICISKDQMRMRRSWIPRNPPQPGATRMGNHPEMSMIFTNHTDMLDNYASPGKKQ